MFRVTRVSKRVFALALGMALSGATGSAALADSVSHLRSEAAKGDAEAQFRLGEAYMNGKGVASDPTQAENYFRQAAERGHILAMEHYGTLLFRRDMALGLPWLRRAAETGDMRAAHIIGVALFNGDGAPIYRVEAYAWLKLATDAGDPGAGSSLEKMAGNLSDDEQTRGRARAEELKRIIEARRAERLGMVGRTAMSGEEMPAPEKVKGEAKRGPAIHAASSVAQNSGGQDECKARACYVQLGAFHDRASAEAAWGLLRQKERVLAAYSPHYMPAGSLMRVRVENLDANHTSALCGALRAHGSACMAGSMD